MANQLALFIDFENIAIWAGENFYDLDLKQLMEYLQSRGPVVVKRAYGDWSKFNKYRESLVENSFDLIQMYSVRSGKNRADIRLALDAFETAIYRKHINQIAIVSGDSDFGELAIKLREYGQYVLGIGPRDRTHTLLVKSCDEFIYLETILALDVDQVADDTESAQENAQTLLKRALEAHGKRGELPVQATRLKQTMLSMDSTFNEVNLGHKQFRSWLEDNNEIAKLYFRGLVMYVTPKDFEVPEDTEAIEVHKPSLETMGRTEAVPAKYQDYSNLYAKVISVDVEPRRDILRIMYRELNEHPGRLTLSTLQEKVESQLEAKGTIYSASVIQKVLQMAESQEAIRYIESSQASSPITLAADIDNQAKFIRRVESKFPLVILQAGLNIDLEEIATVLLADRNETAYAQELLDDLEARHWISRTMGRYHLANHGENPLRSEPHLRQILEDIEETPIPADIEASGEAAKTLATGALAKRTRDFSAAARDFLLACKLQLTAFERGDEDVTLEELRWCIASYASVKAGELAQVVGDFGMARFYYLAFFSLVQEESPLWERMRGLINPMLSFYWRNLAREMNIELRFAMSPAEVAIQLATTENILLRDKWIEATRTLARINPGILRRVAHNIRFLTSDPRSSEVADLIESMLDNH